jgi:hypothetical protein
MDDLAGRPRPKSRYRAPEPAGPPAPAGPVRIGAPRAAQLFRTKVKVPFRPSAASAMATSNSLR